MSGFLHRTTAWVYTIGGGIGLLAAAILLIEKINLLANPAYVPTCSINPILSCGSVMKTAQAEAFGFPNPIIGVAGFAALTAIGVVLLTGAALPRWFWIGLQAGATFAVVFVHWLIYQSLYIINALCPYCMVVWTLTIPVFVYTTLRNVKALQRFAPYHGVILVIWYAVIVAAIVQRFWDYWLTLV